MNRFGDADKFIARWESGAEAGAAKCSSLPAIPATYNAATLTSSHPDFIDQIEPGVCDLVRLLVVDLDWITYSSCEGHIFQATQPFMPRNVGVLPRNESELQQQRYVLYAASAAVNAKTTLGIRVSVRDVMLKSHGGRLRPVLDIVFMPSGVEETYFDNLPEVTKRLSDFILECWLTFHSNQPFRGLSETD